MRVEFDGREGVVVTTFTYKKICYVVVAFDLRKRSDGFLEEWTSDFQQTLTLLKEDQICTL